MRLNSIKLSGFKSFVDPTTVTFPSSMSCIVGPNGCGKSNVIDAVRWVLGESSAKNLRSESMTDVVFNGSSSRKPVSKASVELFFDNKDGRIGGEFSSYSEISVRRSLELDGQSNYYLNGTSCRKKDITDVFLGTGLGPRSYAIIEQGMISQLVSAKPDEMRGYIEEVAGISRYLERKKETESRIKRTKENLSRLDDLREEISRLLFKLQRQAKAAEKYHELRNEEAKAKLMLLGAKWREVSKTLKAKEEEVKAQELKVEQVNSEKNTSDSEIIKLRAKQIELQTTLDNVQQEFYSYGADISRTEQDLSLKKERINEINESISTNKLLIESRTKETQNLVETKIAASNELKNIESELRALKTPGNDEINDAEAKRLESSWLLFITKIKDILSNLSKSVDLADPIELNEEKIKQLVLHIKSSRQDLDDLQAEPERLTKLTQNFLTNASEDAKKSRIDLIDKTDTYANLQA